MTLVRALVGPTGSGKTRAAVTVAGRLGGVILSADARQIYQGLDVATGKEGEPGTYEVPEYGPVPARFLEGVPQIGLDLAQAGERWTAARWHAWANAVVKTLLDADVPVVVAGGTGLYVESLLHGFQFPDTNPALRTALDGQIVSRREPRRRAVRRAELAVLGQRPRAAAPVWRSMVAGIDPPRPELRRDVESRIRSWFSAGRLFEEVEALRRSGVGSNADALTAMGYAEALAVIEHGATLEDAMRATVRRTWAYTRRQRSYFRRRLPEATWFERSDDAAGFLLSGAA